PRADSDLPPGSGHRRVAPRPADRCPRALPGRGMDRHRVAGDHGRRGAQRPGRCPRGPPGRRADPSPSRGGGGVIRTVPGVLGRARALVAPAMREAVGDLAPEIRRVVEYHLGWTDERGRAVDGPGGKAIRPALAILSAEAVGA